MANTPETPEFELDQQETLLIPDVLPVMALRDVVLFPFTIIPLTVGREISKRAVDEALAGFAGAAAGPVSERASREAEARRRLAEAGASPRLFEEIDRLA